MGFVVLKVDIIEFPVDIIDVGMDIIDLRVDILSQLQTLSRHCGVRDKQRH